MVMASIDWTGFTWEAFATLTTGVLAVLAAYVIGRRQVDIAERQTRILERQAELNALEIRSKLFDRRFAVYKAVAALLSTVLVYDAKADGETEQAFKRALNEATFLFSDSIHAKLKGLWSMYCDFGAVASVMKSNYDRTGQYGQAEIERRAALLQRFSDELDALPSTFGDELNLSARPQEALKGRAHRGPRTERSS